MSVSNGTAALAHVVYCDPIPPAPCRLCQAENPSVGSALSVTGGQKGTCDTRDSGKANIRTSRDVCKRTKTFLAEMPSVDTLREVFAYDDRTGMLFWRHRPESHFTSAQYARAWNTRWAGKEALATRGRVGPGPELGPKRGRLTFDGRLYLLTAHRVIWALVHGELPTMEIRHNDRDLTSNRVGNLRQETRRRITDDWRMARPGLRGAYWHCDGYWWSGINDEGRQIYLGRFETPEEASAAWHRAYDAREARIEALEKELAA